MAKGTGRNEGRNVTLQVIFESQNGPNKSWFDYCREPAPAEMERPAAEQWAQNWCVTLKRRENCEFKYRIEEWV